MELSMQFNTSFSMLSQKSSMKKQLNVKEAEGKK